MISASRTRSTLLVCSTASRVRGGVALTGPTRRAFSSPMCAPAQRLKAVFEEYRLEHYSRDTPTRFKKELIRAAQSDEGTIQIQELNQVLINIGKEEERLSEDEFDQLLKAAGEDAKKGRCITTSQMWQLV